MTINKDNLLESIMASIDRINNISSSELPNIGLYMDQVTTFMDRLLKSSARYPEADKILTKTMINNYAKNDLLPPPDKKRYSKEHIVMLIFIFYSKGFLSITDIQTMLAPLSDRYFEAEGDINLCRIFDELFSLEKERNAELKADITAKFEESLKTFEDTEGLDRELLQMFSFIFMLGYDVYVKKLLIEKMLDELGSSYAVTEAKDKPGKKAAKKKDAK